MAKKRSDKKVQTSCYVVTLSVVVEDKEAFMKHASTRLALMGDAMLARREAIDFHVGATHAPNPPSDTIAT